jgi:hypothetical protein
VIEERVHHNYAFLLAAAISAIGRSIDFPEACAWRIVLSQGTGHSSLYVGHFKGALNVDEAQLRCPNGTVKPFLVSLVEPVAYLKSELGSD